MFAIVASDGARLVGLAHYVFHASTSCIAPACYLQDLYTLPEFRSRGVATALIDQVCLAADELGSTNIYWQTQESNTVARRLYDKLARRSDFIIYQKPVRRNESGWTPLPESSVGVQLKSRSDGDGAQHPVGTFEPESPLLKITARNSS
jgi:hypothetical protein